VGGRGAKKFTQLYKKGQGHAKEVQVKRFPKEEKETFDYPQANPQRARRRSGKKWAWSASLDSRTESSRKMGGKIAMKKQQELTKKNGKEKASSIAK